MDQLPEKVPAQEAMVAPGCQELAMLPTEPGPPLQRDFATVGQDRSAHLGGATQLRTSRLSGLKLRDPAALRHIRQCCLYSPKHPLLCQCAWTAVLPPSEQSFRVSHLSRGSPLLKAYYIVVSVHHGKGITPTISTQLGGTEDVHSLLSESIIYHQPIACLIGC